MTRPQLSSPFPEELLAKLPKTDLHVHLDGSLRLQTLIELAKERKVKLPSSSPSGLLDTVFKRAYKNLPEYLKGFEFTVACLQDSEGLERVAYEFCWDCREDNVFYTEVRFAPQLHAHDDFEIVDVLKAVSRGIRRATKEINRAKEIRNGEFPAFYCGIIVCALRFFLPEFSRHYAAYFQALPYAQKNRIYGLASFQLAQAALVARNEHRVPIVGFDLAGQERGFPAKDHLQAYDLMHENFIGKTVHAGEDYGPESIFQAITDCHADRIGHGTWLFSARKIQDPSIKDKKAYVDELVRYVADRRITLEVCLTSNQQTIPEFRNNLKRHPFARMLKERVSVTLCTDNRLVSRTTMTAEVQKAVSTFKLDAKQLKDLLTYGFKRSFYPGPYNEKRESVKQVLDIMERIFEEYGFDATN
jgi:adenosine deaminase